MEKIIDVTALTDALKILLWDRSKSREKMIELAVALIEEAGEEVVFCKDCLAQVPYKDFSNLVVCLQSGRVVRKTDVCSYRERRDSEE